ncbi:MFS transporter [Microbacterium sp. Mcb102]|uniref:MFS transporter n=1 Tax=Microbacterium sp. Mcb102 TaxID=2926012 RepID=UPI0021C8372B|nr:MFS transporter [Microbacterium sp. Mcb102]
MTNAGRARAGLFTAFAGLGVTAAFVPAILPRAEGAIGADLSAAVPALFAGLLVGVLVSGPLLIRRPPQTTLILGSALQAAAIIAVAVASTPGVFIAAAIVAGFGFGLVEASGSVAAKSLAVGSATGLLSALLGTVAVCAAVTPLLVALGSDVRPALGILAVVPLVTIVMLAGPTPAASLAEAPAHRDVRGLLVLLPFAAALPLYVGVETVLSGWSAVIPERILDVDPALAALGTSAFWTLMAIGRFGAAALRRASVSPIVILATATSGAAVLMAAAGMLVRSAPVGALIALAAVVVLLAPSYGLILGLALDRLDPARSAAVTGALVACGAVGGTFVPTLILLVGRDPASSTTFFVSAALCALVPVLVLIAARSRVTAPTTD